MKGETCIVCGASREQGLHILGSNICPLCERRIMNTDASDKQYEMYVHKLLGVAKKARHV